MVPIRVLKGILLISYCICVAGIQHTLAVPQRRLHHTSHYDVTMEPTLDNIAHPRAQAGSGYALAWNEINADARDKFSSTEEYQYPESNFFDWLTSNALRHQQRPGLRLHANLNFPSQNTALPFTKFQSPKYAENMAGRLNVARNFQFIQEEDDGSNQVASDSASGSGYDTEQLKADQVLPSSAVHQNINNLENFVNAMVAESLAGSTGDEVGQGRQLPRPFVSVKRSLQPFGVRSDYDVLEPQVPRYPYAHAHHGNTNAMPSLKRNAFNQQEEDEGAMPVFLPSVSAGAMTNLGDFFRDLSKNVHFSERSELRQAEENLLDGKHPLRGFQEPTSANLKDPEQTSKLMHAIKAYRPSHKIRSLVSMNPQGYHGSQFIDPNYMWIGLGK